MNRYVRFVFDNSLLLIAGALGGLAWANLAPTSYQSLLQLGLTWGPEQGISAHFLVNDVLMAFFFALAGKEVWGAMLPGGSLRDWQHSATPVFCAVGGMAGPAAIYAIGAVALGIHQEVGRGWAIPCATDIAFSYLIARLVFGRHHPATPFLLLLAIADDALGLLVLALFYPQKPVEFLWLLLPAAAVVLGLMMRRGGIKSFWWYLIVPGGISWVGLLMAGIHPALGLLPIIPTIPHARTGEEIDWTESPRRDELDKFDAAFKKPVELILGLFGLFNAGVYLGQLGWPTWLVLGGLLLGKPVGIVLAGIIMTRVGFKLAQGMSWRELLVLGFAAGIGFTVALFVATVAFPPGVTQDEAKMGALASCLAVVSTVGAAKLLGVKRKHDDDNIQHSITNHQ